MIQDLHSHTYYSFCGKDKPEAVVETAIAGDITLLGITDHAHGIGYGPREAFDHRKDEWLQGYQLQLQKYFDHITTIRDRYSDRITLLRGIELNTQYDEQHHGFALPADADISFFDYCLIEHLDADNTLTGGDPFAYAVRCGTPWMGVAHTDLFAHIKRRGEDPLSYFKRMAAQNIFWEMNVNDDTIHNHYQHPYVADFFADGEKQQIVRESGVRISIGFDGHRVEDYLPERVKKYNLLLTEMGIKRPFED